MITLYWISVLGNISDLAAGALGLFVGLCILSSFAFFYEDCFKSNKKAFKISLIGVFVSLALCVLIPSKKELYAIYGIGSVIDYAKDSKEVQKLPDNAVKALNVYLENVQKKDSTNSESK